MSTLIDTPAPRDWETRTCFNERWTKHPTVIRAYPAMGKRRLMADRRWEQAKQRSLVSIKTEANETLLFGGLD